MKTRLNLSQSESGFASIVISIVIIIVLSLITVGFAQLMRREQREALDRQLSSQAYYAAESGVNIAHTAISNGFSDTKDNCTTVPSGDNNYFPSNASATNGIPVGGTSVNSYVTCLLITPTPSNIQFGPVGSSTPTVTEVTGLDQHAHGQIRKIHDIYIDWSGTSSNNSNFVAANDKCNSLPPESSWTYPPVMQFEVIPIDSINRAALMSNSFTAFLCPSAPNNPTDNVVSYSGGNVTQNGPIVGGACVAGTQYVCHAQIGGLAGVNQGSLVLSFSSMYDTADVNISIDGCMGLGNCAKPLNIGGSQTLVDSTGKAQDVLRRIQARVSLKNSYPIPVGTIGGDICKQLQVGPTNAVTGQSPAGRKGSSATECRSPNNYL